jgi:hypothetical protein
MGGCAWVALQGHAARFRRFAYAPHPGVDIPVKQRLNHTKLIVQLFEELDPAMLGLALKRKAATNSMLTPKLLIRRTKY